MKKNLPLAGAKGESTGEFPSLTSSSFPQPARRANRSAWLLTAIALGAGEVTVRAATADFLGFPIGPRTVAMGETGAASADDAGSLFWNPAALDFLPRMSGAAGRALYLDAAHDFAAFTRNLNTRGSAGIGLSLLSYDPLETSNIEGSPTGSLEPREWQLLAGYGRRLRGPSWLAGHGWGVGVKWISSTLGDTDQTTALDAGFLSRPADRWRWGMAITNVGRGLKRGDTVEPLPRALRLGAAWTPNSSWTVNSDLRWGKEIDPVVGGGVEYARVFSPQKTLFVRGGYTSEDFRTEPWNGLRMGFGTTWKNLRIDYSFRFVQESEAAHSLGLSLHFDAPEKSLPPALQALVDRGNRQLKMNQYPEAVLTFEEALILSPSCPPAWEGLELARQRMGGR